MKRRATPLLYTILLLSMIIPFFYIRVTYKPFAYPKYYLLSLSILLLSIYIVSHKVDLVIPSPFFTLFLFFIPFTLRWIFTPFPRFSLFFTLFFLSYPLLVIILLSVGHSFELKKKYFIWMWVFVSQLYALVVLLIIHYKVPAIILLIKKIGLFELVRGSGSGFLGGNPNYSAEFLGFSLISLFILFFHEKVRFNFVSYVPIDVLIKIALILNIFFAMVFLSSRAALASVILGLSLYMFLMMSKSKIYLVLLLVVILLVVSFYYFPSLRSHLPAKLRIITNPDLLKSQMTLRLFYWKTAWYMGLENPLFGKGPGMFRAEFFRVAKKLKEKKHISLVEKLFSSKSVPLFPPNAHSDPLEFWSEGGIFLIIYFLLFFFYIPWTLSGLSSFWDRARIIVPFVSLIANSFFAFPLHLPILFPFIGIYMYLILSPEVSHKDIKEHLNYALLLLSVLLFALVIQFLLGSVYLQSGRFLKSFPVLKKSSILDPLEPKVWDELYKVSIKDKQSIDEKLYILRNKLKIVDSPGIRYVISGLLGKKGKYKEAIEHLKMAISLWEANPDLYLYYYKMGYYYYKLKDLDNAIKYTEMSIEKNKKNLKLKKSAYRNLAVFYAEKKDFKTAIEMAKKAEDILKTFMKRDPKNNEYREEYRKFETFIKELREKL